MRLKFMALASLEDTFIGLHIQNPPPVVERTGWVLLSNGSLHTARLFS